MTLKLIKSNVKIKYLIMITCILSIIVLISYFITYQEEMDMISLVQSTAEDINIDNVKKIIATTNGLTYFFNFLLSADFFIIFILIFSISSIFIFGRNIIDDLSNGRGNLIVSRIGYKKYLISNILAQTIFNFIYLIIFFSFLFFISYIFNGNYDLSNGVLCSTNIHQYSSIVSYYINMILTTIFIGIMVSLLTITATVINTIVKNKYAIQLFPLIIYLITLCLGSIIGNLLNDYYTIISTFILDAQIGYIREMFLTNKTSEFISISIFLILFILITVKLYNKNLNKFEKEYIL